MYFMSLKRSRYGPPGLIILLIGFLLRLGGALPLKLGGALLMKLGEAGCSGGDHPINRGSYSSLVEPFLLKLGRALLHRGTPHVAKKTTDEGEKDDTGT